MAARPPCAKCNQPLLAGKPVAKALGKAFHKECLVCADCNVSVVGVGFAEGPTGFPQCAACSSKATEESAPKLSCKLCARDITSGYTNAYGFVFHVFCMNCAVCTKAIDNDGMFDDETRKVCHLGCLPQLVNS